MKTDIYIPNRFESVLSNPEFKDKPIILPVDTDLEAFDWLYNKTLIQRGGILCFLLGVSGSGKTTSVYSAATFRGKQFTGVYPVPTDLELREVLSWLRKGNIPSPLPSSVKKTHLILFDGRELTDDIVGVREFLSGLNQLLRGRQDIIFCWPTTDTEWHKQIKELAEKIGGTNFVPLKSDIQIQGPPRTEWIQALKRILIQLDLSFDDLAIDPETLESNAQNCNTIGEFLGQVSDIIAQRTTDVQKQKKLPSLVFVVTSGSKVAGEANRIRRARSYLLKAEELLDYSATSRVGKWWREHCTKPEHQLSYIISLFDAKLTTMTPSAVSRACLEHGEIKLKSSVLNEGLTASIAYANKTLKATDLYRFLTGQTLRQLTSTPKGKANSATIRAYAAIQSKSAKSHKAINTAICSLLKQNIEKLEIKGYEVHGGNQNLYTDAIINIDEQEFYLEFHHLSDENCYASRMAAYIMEKLQSYAIHYNLIPR